MEKIKLSVAQAIIKFLDNQFIEVDGQVEKYIDYFGIIYGHGNVVGIGQALEEIEHSFHILQGRNEQGLGHMAIGYAKQKLRQKIMVISTSIGPGSANLVTAAATATANRIPLLLLPADTFATRRPDPVLQQIEFESNLEVTTNNALQAVCKFWDRINRPEQLISSLLKAMAVLTDQAQTGAVVISLPQDVQGETFEYPIRFFKKRIHKMKRIVPNESDAIASVAILQNAKRPLLIVGGGAKYSNAKKEISKFSMKFNIPFVETQAGKGTIESAHCFNLGGVGVTGNLGANKYAKTADVVIGLGTRYSDFTTCSKTLFNENCNFVNININSWDSNKMDALSFISDVRLAVLILSNELKKIEYIGVDKKEIESLKLEWQNELKKIKDKKLTSQVLDYIEVKNNLDFVKESLKINGSHLHQTQVLLALNEIIDSNAIVVGAAGSLPGDLQRIWKTKKFNTYHVEYGYSCMGYEIAAGVGAKLANPEKEVYVLVGDGSFMLLHSELITALQENIKINIIVFDNNGFGCIDNLQVSYGLQSNGTNFKYREQNKKILTGKIIETNFSLIAQGYGCQTYQLKKLEELSVVINEMKMAKQVTLLEIKVLPKTMTHDYESWWDVGVTNQTSNIRTLEMYEEKINKLK